MFKGFGKNFKGFVQYNKSIDLQQKWKTHDFAIRGLSQNFKGVRQYNKCIDFAIEMEKHIKIDENRVRASGEKSVKVLKKNIDFKA